ncbi:MAG: LytTR family DNA-binding domain-containing protein [Caldimonas sp.]
MKSPTCVIAEDERLLRDELRETLAVLWPELVIVAEAADGIQAVRALQEHEPQLLFLDIEMPGLTGLEVAAHASRRCHVVFVTAYDKYALAAFEQGAVDYVLKPFLPARLAGTVGRLKDRLASQPANLDALLASLTQRENAPRPLLRWIRASQGASVRLIMVQDVFFFQADNKYTVLTTATGDAMIRTPLQELLPELNPETFWQIHRSTIVNVNEIAAVKRRANGTLELRLKRCETVLSVSTTHAHLFKQM